MKISLALLFAPLVALAAPSASRPGNLPRSGHVAQRQAPVSIDQLFKRKGKLYIGVSTDNGIIQQNTTEAIIKANFGQVTPEYSMKWDATEPSRGSFSFENSDFLVRWALQNRKSIRGHTLLWHRALPDWVANIKDKAVLKSVIETHVRTIVGRYRGLIRSWDVVNEIFEDSGALRNNTFYNVLGESYIEIAFKAARAADPAAKLYINDYNLDNQAWGKPVAVVKKVDEWIKRGIPIDGIGSQSHLAKNMAQNTQGALELLAKSTVSEIAITELDIVGATPSEYATVVGACLNVPKCRGITIWGVSDRQSWMADAKPLLFDANFRPKPAYNAIVKRLS
ncbi:glycosyl hydrolase family 10 [Colletotrichum sojae]|uniref:Beta-xylanase n=1 Tax=Colletotrichum sojae TaxID=2175907 RepID=A0A8H6J3L0_9PEZI|nr:glycosyl hydrolase family 10 [Colletotrichum sojae]